MPSRATMRWLLAGACLAIGCVWAVGAWAQAAEAAVVAGKSADWLLTQGPLGLTTLAALALSVWALWQKGKAEDALRDNDKERVAEAKEIGKLTAEISRTMATLAAAMEANNRTQAEGNIFRQTIAQSVESLEKSVNATGAGTAADIRELRTAFGELSTLILRNLPRGPA